MRHRRPEVALKYLQAVVRTLPPHMELACQELLSSTAFKRQFGGISRHHDYEGGLLVHTAEVVMYARKMALGLGYGPSCTVTVAAMFHDFAKVHSYETDPDNLGKVRKAQYESHIGHVVGSYAYFLDAAKVFAFSPEEKLAIGHAMLAHHGRLEWRSPVEPKTPIAHILHAADMWSASGGGCGDWRDK